MKKQLALHLTAVFLAFSGALSAQSWSLTGNAGTTPSTDYIGTSDSKPLKIKTNNIIRMYIKPNGYIGMGTQTPASRLHVKGDVTAEGGTFTNELRIGGTTGATGYVLAVNGKAIAEEVRVELQNAWPDYVFQDDYNLMPLAELKAEINANKHLPGLPSAAELTKEGGIDLGAMQTKLVEKVEELTLYIIQVKEQNDRLEKINRELMQRIQALETNN